MLFTRSQFLNTSFLFCGTAPCLIEKRSRSVFSYFLCYLLPGVKIVVCHSVSTDHPFRAPASRLNLDNDQLLRRHPGPRYQTQTEKYTSTATRGPGCRDEKCERGEKIPGSAGAEKARACLCINWLELGEFRDGNLIPSDSRSSRLARPSPVFPRQSAHSQHSTKWLEPGQTTFVRSIKIISRQTEHGNKRKWIGNQSMPENGQRSH